MHYLIKIKPIPEFEDKDQGYSLEEFLLIFSSMYLNEKHEELTKLKLTKSARKLHKDLLKGKVSREDVAKGLAKRIINQVKWLDENSPMSKGNASRTTDLHRDNAVLHFYEIFLETYSKKEFMDKVFIISKVFDNNKDAAEFDFLLYLLGDKPEDLAGIRVGSALFSSSFVSLLEATRNLKESIERNQKPLRSLVEPGSKFMRDSRSLGNRDLTLYRLLKKVSPESVEDLSENSTMREIFARHPKVKGFIRLAFSSKESVFRLEEFFSEDSRPLEVVVKVATQGNSIANKTYTYHTFEEFSKIDLQSDEDPVKLLALSIAYYNFLGTYNYSKGAYTPWFYLDGVILLDSRNYIMQSEFMEFFSVLYDYPEELSELTVPMIISSFLEFAGDFEGETGFTEDLLRIDRLRNLKKDY